MDDPSSPKKIDVILNRDIHMWGKGEGSIVAEITSSKSEPKEFIFDDKTPSLEILKASTAESNVQLPPQDEKRVAQMLDNAREFETEWRLNFEIAGFSLGPDSPLFLPIKFHFWKKSKGKK